MTPWEMTVRKVFCLSTGECPRSQVIDKTAVTMYRLPLRINVQTLGVICGVLDKQKKVLLIQFESALWRMWLYSFKLKIYISSCVILVQILRTHLLYKRYIVVIRVHILLTVYILLQDSVIWVEIWKLLFWRREQKGAFVPLLERRMSCM